MGCAFMMQAAKDTNMEMGQKFSESLGIWIKKA